MMRCGNRFLLAVFCLSLLEMDLAKADSSVVSPLEDFIGEHLEYSLQYYGITTARANLSFNSAESTTVSKLGVISFAVKTGSFSDVLFHIDNHYSSFVDMASGMPVKFAKSVDQKNVQQDLTTEYDRLSQVARITAGNPWPIAEESYELFSMLYKTRCSDIHIGDSLNYILDVEGESWQAIGGVTEGEVAHKPFQHLNVRKIVLTFSPASSLVPRVWKTDLLTNRICKVGARLTICLGPPPQNLPLYLQFGEGKSAVEMRLQQVYFPSKTR